MGVLRCSCTYELDIVLKKLDAILQRPYSGHTHKPVCGLADGYGGTIGESIVVFAQSKPPGLQSQQSNSISLVESSLVWKRERDVQYRQIGPSSNGTSSQSGNRSSRSFCGSHHELLKTAEHTCINIAIV